MHHIAREIAEWVGILISQAETKTERQALKCDTDMTILFRVPRDRRERLNHRSSTGKPGREVQNQHAEVKLNHNNLEISNTRFIEKVFANVRQKLFRPEGDQVVLIQKKSMY